MLEAFRNEIIEAKKARIGLFKWKILLVAIIGGVSLGIGQTQTGQGQSNKTVFGDIKDSPIHMLIFLIPFICVYVDLLTKHLQIQILTISKYFQNNKKFMQNEEFLNFKHYEQFCEKVRSEFKFEDWAQTISTRVICFLVTTGAFFVCRTWPEFCIVVLSSFIGVYLTFILERSYKRKYSRLDKAANYLAK